MQSTNTNLDVATVALTLNHSQRSAVLAGVTGLPHDLVELLRQERVRRDRIPVSPRELELLDSRLSEHVNRSISKETRSILKEVKEQVVDELNLLNSRTSSVAVDNAAHTLYKSSLRSKLPLTLEAALGQLAKIRALPLRLREFKLTQKDKRLLQKCDLPAATMQAINMKPGSINLADVLLIFATRYRLDRVTQAGLIEELLAFRNRVLEHLDQESLRTSQIRRRRALQSQQEWRRDRST